MGKISIKCTDFSTLLFNLQQVEFFSRNFPLKFLVGLLNKVGFLTDNDMLNRPIGPVSSNNNKTFKNINKLV